MSTNAELRVKQEPFHTLTSPGVRQAASSISPEQQESHKQGLALVYGHGLRDAKLSSRKELETSPSVPWQLPSWCFPHKGELCK